MTGRKEKSGEKKNDLYAKANALIMCMCEQMRAPLRIEGRKTIKHCMLRAAVAPPSLLSLALAIAKLV